MNTAGLPEEWPHVGFTEEWYESLPIRWAGEYAVARGRTPWMRWYFDRGPIGEHARWVVDLSLKYERFHPWKFWSLKDLEPAIGMRFFTVSPLERGLGWALTAVALWGMR